MDSRHEIFLRIAIELAVENVRSGRGGPFGAVVVKDGEIIGRGTNTVTAENDPTAHAEINAIRDACRNLGEHQLHDCIVYSSCEPCPMCLGAIYWARPERVVYSGTRGHAAGAGFDDAFIYEELGADPGKRRIPVIHFPLEAASEPFRLWLSDSDRHEY